MLLNRSSRIASILFVLFITGCCGDFEISTSRDVVWEHMPDGSVRMVLTSKGLNSSMAYEEVGDWNSTQTDLKKAMKMHVLGGTCRDTGAAIPPLDAYDTKCLWGFQVFHELYYVFREDPARSDDLIIAIAKDRVRQSYPSLALAAEALHVQDVEDEHFRFLMKNTRLNTAQKEAKDAVLNSN